MFWIRVHWIRIQAVLNPYPGFAESGSKLCWIWIQALLIQAWLNPDCPKTNKSWLVIEPGPPRWEASTRGKNHSNSLLIAIGNIYIWACNQWRILTTWLPPVHVLYEHTWTALWCGPNSSCQEISHLHVRVFTVKQDRSRWGHYYEETWPRWETSTLEKSFSNGLTATFRTSTYERETSEEGSW